MKNNPLNGSTCYLSGPIELAEGPNWRDEPKRILAEKYGINVFDPFADPKQQWAPDLAKARAEKDYAKMREIAQKFVSKDLSMVYQSNFLIAYLPFRVPTTGTHHEIVFSSDAKKPTLLVCPQGKEYVPLWYYGFIKHEAMFGSWEDMYSYLDEVQDGKHTANRRWQLLYGLI